MTRRRRLAVMLGLALFAAACAESRAGGLPGGGKPRDSTETGNPPVIDVSAVALVVRSDEVHIVGGPGAVTPGGIEVEVDNLRSGEEQRGPVAEDGSFDVRVTGTMEDTYAVRAVGKAPSAVSAPIYVHRGGATVEERLSCEQRADVIEAELAEVASNVDRSCSSNADCTQLTAPVSCPGWPCGGPVASRAASTAVAPAIEAVADAWCEPFARDDCFLGMPQPGCILAGPFACVEQQCVDCISGGCEQATCEPCTTPRIEWTLAMGPTRNTHVLTGCKTLTAPDDCTSEPPCVVSRDAGDSSQLSIADVQNKLAAPDVQAALADGTRFGAVTPGAHFTEIRVGERSFTVHDALCEGQQDCRDAPSDVSNLAGMLQSFAAQHACAQ